ncbi:MAG: AP2/ERF family transcription factor, partial [Candidatus Cryosericum sp.]
THQQNLCNRGAQTNNKSGYKGVSWHKAARKWEAAIHYNGQKVYLGLFPTAIKAAKAYNKRAVELHGAFAHLNKV